MLRILAIGRGDRTHVTTRVESIAKAGNNVELMTQFTSSNPNISTFYPKQPANWPGPFRFIQDINRLFHTIRGIRVLDYDIYHIHNAAKLDAWATLVAGKRPLAVSLMGGDIHFDERTDFSLPHHARMLIKLLLSQADLITVKSSAMKQAAIRHGANVNKISTVLWGIDTNRFTKQDSTQLREKLGIPSHRLVVFSSRYLKPFYNIETLVTAFKTVLENKIDAQLLLATGVCSPKYEQRVRKQVKDLGIEQRVTFLRNISHEEMPAYFSLSDVTVNLPPSDGMPQSLLESLACETPAVLTNLNRYRDVVGDEECALFTAIDPTEVSKALLALLQSPNLRKTMGQRGREIVCDKAEISQEGERVSRMFSRLLDQPRRKTPSHIRLFATILLTFHVASTIARNIIRRTLETLYGNNPSQRVDEE